MSFVKLNDLNDFIKPSSTCVKPIAKKPTPGVVAKVQDVNLSDCLACSGCITSAESVLVQQQTHDELFKVINANKTSQPNKLVVVTMSLQTVASLAYKFHLGVQETAERLAAFFISLGCHRVYDINLARHLALVETTREFKRRKLEGDPLPIISSICPGWICYAEKTNGEAIIPHLSQVRSPQQIMGALLKRQCKESEQDIYHVALMPCFDKKLEASRPDFKHGDEADVDCVLTPVELEEILEGEAVELADFERRKLDVLGAAHFQEPLSSHPGRSTSGGYAENLLLSLAGGGSVESLDYSASRNADFIEVSSQNPQCKALVVNGFRNIQTVIQRLKRKALKGVDYIEIMACPSGCINGGAQCRPRAGHDQAAATSHASQLYAAVPRVEAQIHDELDNAKLYHALGLTSEAGADPADVLYTQFRAVPKMQNLTVNW